MEYNNYNKGRSSTLLTETTRATERTHAASVNRNVMELVGSADESVILKT